LGSPAIFNGPFVKLLKDQLRFGNTARILTGTDNPQIVATDGEPGSIYMEQGSSGRVLFKLDSGVTTNWHNLVSSVTPVVQATHGLSVGDIIYFDGADYLLALADTEITAEVVGVVSSVLGPNSFEFTTSGLVSGYTGLTPGQVYFLSETTPGGLELAAPTVIGMIDMPIGIALSATELYVNIRRGAVVGGANARTELPLTNDDITNINDVSAYDAGEMTGWVEIDGTTDTRFYIAMQFSKTGANNDFNISYQVSGDAVPVGFDIDITSAGIIQLTMPLITGFISAKINYSLNAPAVGVTLPLAIDASKITTGVIPQNVADASIVSSGIVTPVGSVIAYNPGYYTDGINGGFTTIGPIGNTVAQVNAYLPGNWRVCDGAELNDSASPIFNGAGRYLPNLTDSRFIMGATTAGTAASGSTGDTTVSWSSTTVNTTFTQPSMPAHYHSAAATGATINVTSSGSHAHSQKDRIGVTSGGNVPTGGAGIINNPTTSTNTGDASHTHPTANITGLAGLVTGGQNGDTATATTGGAASFNKTALNTDQTAHSHTSVLPTYLSSYYIMRIK
jgi:hypothetical protein